MIKYDITATEFQKRYDAGDIICILAQQMAAEAFGQEYNLMYKKPATIIQFIHRAEEMIKQLKKHNLEIIHIKKKDIQNEQE